MLYGVPSLQDIDQSVLAEIDEMRDRLRLHLRTSRRWEGQLRRNLTARAIAGSNTIEGYAASLSDVEDIMVGEAPIDANDTVTAEIEGYRQAMTYIQRLAEAGDDFAYSKGLLNALHFMMQGHHLIKRPGWWRTGPVFATSAEDPTIAAYTAPDAEQVPALAGELVEWLNGGDLDAPGLVRASMAHLNLVAIHPWSDGNGRMSRALHTLVLAREGIMAPEFSSIAVEQRGWPDRMLYALYPAAMGNRVRRATYQTDAELSEQQAQRDIRELVRAGWLTAKGEAQGRYYTAGPDLPEEIARGIREPRPLRDPYAYLRNAAQARPPSR
ncbi:Fic family protein [Kitasatospora sp. NPDC057936]|uniref:Fic family protein n=1 Tax=Kitasatospora sp. NPDC057936 TaxID=3346283 RepID=UPI0036DEDC9D